MTDFVVTPAANAPPPAPVQGASSAPRRGAAKANGAPEFAQALQQAREQTPESKPPARAEDPAEGAEEAAAALVASQAAPRVIEDAPVRQDAPATPTDPAAGMAAQAANALTGQPVNALPKVWRDGAWVSALQQSPEAPAPAGAVDPTAANASAHLEEGTVGSLIGEAIPVPTDPTLEPETPAQPVFGQPAEPKPAEGEAQPAPAGESERKPFSPVAGRQATLPVQGTDEPLTAPEPKPEPHFAYGKQATLPVQGPEAEQPLPVELVDVSARPTGDPVMAQGMAQPAPLHAGKNANLSFGLDRLAETHSAEVLQQVANAFESMRKLGSGSSLHLQLSPQELGRIDMHLTQAGEGLRILIHADQAATGQLLEREMDRLRQTLEQAGVQLSQLSVSQQDRQAPGHGMGQGQTQGNRYGHGHTGPSAQREEASPAPAARRTHSGVVDLAV